MGKLNALLLAGAVAFGAIGTAHAADLPYPPSIEPMAPEPVEFGGWYLRGDWTTMRLTGTVPAGTAQVIVEAITEDGLPRV